jgi:hypothetical protein
MLAPKSEKTKTRLMKEHIKCPVVTIPTMTPQMPNTVFGHLHKIFKGLSGYSMFCN